MSVKMSRRMPTGPASVVVCLLGTLLAGLGWSATLPTGPGDLVSEFGVERARGHVEAIAATPRPIGSESLAAARNYVLAEFERLGLETDVQEFEVAGFFGSGRMLDAANVVGWIPGTDHTRAVLVSTHVDTHPDSPGANDDAAGVAVILETARVIRDEPMRNDVVFLVTDAEEPAGRKGMRTFMSVPGMPERFGFAVNLEANGAAGASLLAEISGSQQWVLDGYVAAVDRPAAFSFLTGLSAALGDIGTDFDVIDEVGIAGVNLAYLRDSTRYHTPGDDTERLALGSMQHHGAQVLALVRHFGAADLTERPDLADEVFFTVSGLVVRYPAGWSVALAGIAVVLAATATAAAVRRGRVGLGPVGRSMMTATLMLLAGVMAGTVVWLQASAARTIQTAPEGYAYMFLTLAATTAAMRAVRRMLPTQALLTVRLGWLWWWTTMAVASALLLPGAGYLFLWPAMATGIVILAPLRWHLPGMVRYGLVAAPTLVLLAPAIDTLFLFAQPRPGNPDSQLLHAVVVPVLLAALVAGLLASGWYRTEPD